MEICCLDLEGILVPEVWIAVAKKTGIEALKRTTRDEPNYDTLMKYRLKILDKHGIKLRDIQSVIGTMSPLPGAKAFIDKLESVRQVILLSDTFYEFAHPLMKKLGFPTLFCNWLVTNKKGEITGYRLRQKNGKAKAVRALRSAGFKTAAVGDSYNDLTMLKTADRGVLFRPPSQIVKDNPQLTVVKNYSQLYKALVKK